MGSRANLIVISGASGYELYYSHWGAYTLDSSLLWGPERALAFMRQQRSAAEGATWLDEVWAEGGALLDSSARKLLWFGGQDSLFEVPIRRVYLGIMRELWPGWTVEWAHEGVVALARYVGEPVEPLRYRSEPVKPQLREPDEPDWISCVISFREHGRFKIHAQDCDDVFELCGPSLLAPLRAASLPDRYDYASRTSEFPLGGIHIDADAMRVDAWSAETHADPVSRLRAAWPGWETAWHFDRFEAMAELLGDRLVLPRPTDDELIARIRSKALSTPRDKSILVREVGATLTEKGKEVSFGPFALRDDPPPAPDQADARAFDEAVARWRARRFT